MFVTTQDNVITSVKWWAQMLVDGDEIIVRTDPDADEEVRMVVLSHLDDPDATQALFKDLNKGITQGKDHFDVLMWTESWQPASGE